MQMKTHVLVAFFFLNSRVANNILYRKKCLVCHCGGVWISEVLEFVWQEAAVWNITLPQAPIQRLAGNSLPLLPVE